MCSKELGATLEIDGPLLKLGVPGLQEKRPSVLYGDKVIFDNNY